MHTTKYMTNLTADTSRGPSNTLWLDCPWMDMLQDPGIGIQFWDDFINAPTMSSDADTALYAAYIDTSNTITQAATAGGVLALTTDATDNDAPVVQAGGGTGGSFQITTATAGKLWFEARIKVSTLTEMSVFVGLAAPGATVDNGLLVNDTGALATTVGSIGFNAPTSASASEIFRAAYVKASATSQYPVTAVHTAVADTWVKLGFKFDPYNDTITWYVNGIANATTTDVGDAGTTNFPSAVLLSPAIGMKNGEAGAKTLSIDWWRCAQLL